MVLSSMWRCPRIFGAAVLLSAIPRSECVSPHKIVLKPHSTSYTEPTGIVADPTDPSRLFVLERGGLIKIVPTSGGPVATEPFLDVSTNLGVCDAGYCTETGLLGLVFHPEYGDNGPNSGKFYLDYTQHHETETNDDGPSWCSKKVLTTIISEFTVDPNDSSKGDPGSERQILTFNQPYCNHNGGGLAFGPEDGYLYIASGDGGSGGDPEGYGQNTQTMLGKLLRIDVDSGSNNYNIPPNNPFVDDANVLDEIWAYGVRNPWRISFDTESKGLHIADVGQSAWEEVNFQPKGSPGGQNYGWNMAEGNHCFKEGCDEEDPDLTWPILEYPHEDNDCSITGGHVHRGKDKNLHGRYFYGDYCTGKIWSAKENKKGKTKVELMHSATDYSITSFGRDADGDLYVIDFGGKMAKIKGCKDSKKFTKKFNGEKMTCKMIGETTPKKIAKYCGKEIVSKKCMKTCDAC